MSTILEQHNQHLDDMAKAILNGEDRDHCNICLGTRVSSGEFIYYKFEKNIGSNLLILGANCGKNNHFINSIIFQLALFACSSNSVLDHHKQLNIIDADHTKHSVFVSEIVSELNIPVKLESGFNQELTIIQEMSDQLQTLAKGGCDNNSQFIVTLNLQYLRKLRSEGSYKVANEIDISEKFIDILRLGPKLGIHTTIFCSNHRNFEMTIGSNSHLFDAVITCNDDQPFFFDGRVTRMFNLDIYHDDTKEEEQKFWPITLGEIPAYFYKYCQRSV